MHLQLFILLLGFVVEFNHCERVLRFGNSEESISIYRELGVSLARSSCRAHAPGASERTCTDR